MRKLPFVKMHGCGNDFVYAVADRMRPAAPPSAPLVRGKQVFITAEMPA